MVSTSKSFRRGVIQSPPLLVPVYINHLHSGCKDPTARLLVNDIKLFKASTDINAMECGISDKYINKLKYLIACPKGVLPKTV